MAVCVGMASSLAIGILLYDEISYPLLFTNDAFGIRVSDSKGTMVWHAPYNEKHTVIEPKQTQTIEWDTMHFDPGTYTASSHVSTIDASIMITLT